MRNSILNTTDLRDTYDDLKRWEKSYQDEVMIREDYVDKEDYLTEDDEQELEDLDNLRIQMGPDFNYDTELIPEDEFEDYIKDYVESNYDIPDFLYGNIDWKGVASDLSSDYSVVDFQGVTYYYK